MKARAVYMHTDFAPDKMPKIVALRNRLLERGVELIAVEGAGRGGLYAGLPPQERDGSWWECLCPDRSMWEIPAGRLFAAFTGALDRLRPDVVLCGAVAYSSGAAAVNWGARNRVPVVLMDDARRRNVSRGRLVNLIKRWFHENCDAALLPAPAWTPDYEWWGIPAERHFYGYSAIDHHPWIERCAEATAAADERRRERQLPDRFFLGVGRLIAAKNWLPFLHAYRQYAAGVPDPWALVLVGSGPDELEIRRMASADSAGTILLRSPVGQDELGIYYSLCSALVLPSVNETWGGVVSEAMCCGVPVLVSRLCGCAETLVREGENGCVLDPHDVKSMAVRLREIADLPEDRFRLMGEASRRLVSEWGVERYLAGAWGAVQFCFSHPKRIGRRLSSLVLPLWKGRYRPV